MIKLNHQEIINLMFQLGIMLLVGRALAEAARRLRQPAVVGELLAGILLGATVLGNVAPDLFTMLFPDQGPSSVVLDGFVQVAVVLLLFISGLEVDLHIVLQQGRQALWISLFSLIVPFGLGFLFTYFLPAFFGGSEEQRLILSLFIGTILGMTALPVVARILMDLNVFKSRMGMLIIASAMIVDILCWLIFSVVLGQMDGQEAGESNPAKTIMFTIGFMAIMLTGGRFVINQVLPWINKKLAWPGGLLSLSLAICFLAAAFTEFIGIHAIFGAFVIGIALGDSEHLSERAKEIIHQFINNIFAPLFFVSIGLYIDFLAGFNFVIVLVFILLAFVSKVFGASLGAKIGGTNLSESLAIGFGMNTHGTLEVILGTIAFQAGIISQQVFIAIIMMVLVTILVSAPLMKFMLQWRKKKKHP
ncbi:MAG: cation:proton antiporter [Cyclobacteriaceae bacterium]